MKKVTCLCNKYDCCMPPSILSSVRAGSHFDISINISRHILGKFRRKGANYQHHTASAYVGLCLCLCQSVNQPLKLRDRPVFVVTDSLNMNISHAHTDMTLFRVSSFQYVNISTFLGANCLHFSNLPVFQLCLLP